MQATKGSVTNDIVTIVQLRSALADAIEGMEDMIPYVPEYFQEKWDHRGYIERAKQSLAELK